MAKKIMLVEDDNNLREIYEARLTAEGYEIVAAENGEAALAMAAKERPDMIISDVMMPKISGFEMLDILRNTDGLKNTKVIMLTALGQAEDSQRANSLGADRYLVKSQVTLEDIVKAAHDLLDDPNTMATVSQSGSDSIITPETPAETAASPAPEAMPVAEPAAEPETAAPAAPDMSVAAEPDMNVTPVPEQAADSADTAAPEVQEAPAAEPQAAEPVAAPDVVAEPPAVPEAVAAPADMAVSPAPEPPAPAPAVISIPVSDADDDASVAPAATDASANEGATADTSDTSLPVAEPPVAIDVPVSEAPQESDPVAEAAPTEQPAAEPETAAQAAPADASALEAQINAFINNGTGDPAADTAQTQESTPETGAATAEQSGQPEQSEQPAQPSIEIPSVIAEPTVSSDDGLPTDVSDAAGPADDVPAPEQLDSFTAPVIEAPEGAAVPEPQDVPVPEATSPVSVPDAAPEQPTVEEASAEDKNADQLREAAEGLAAGASAGAESAVMNPVSANATNRMRIISPINNGESKPDINQLLALEEAKNSALQAAQTTEAPRPNVDAYAPAAQPAPQPPQTPDQTIDPNSISL